MVKILLMIASFTSPLVAQEIVISGNPDLLYSTANDAGPWGSPDFLNSFTNDVGPLGSPDFLGSVTNDVGLGITALELSILTPNIINPEEFAPKMDITSGLEFR